MGNSTVWVVSLIACLASAAAGAQQQTPPPPATAGSAPPAAHARKQPAPKAPVPTLEFTMEYIQDKLISRGVLTYEVALHDDAAAKDWSYDFSDKLSGIYVNNSTCEIGFHWKQTRSGKVVTDKEMFFDLDAIPAIDVLPMDQFLTESNIKGGHPSWTTKVSPAVFVLRITKPGNPENNFVFPDEDVANHVAKAMAHAAELCVAAQAVAAPADKKEPF